MHRERHPVRRGTDSTTQYRQYTLTTQYTQTTQYEASSRESAMASKPPAGDPVQDAPQVAPPQHAADGLSAIGHTLRMAQQQMGVRRSAQTLLKVN